MSEHRALPVPDGLDGLRLDAALARLFGLSRASASALVEQGNVRVDGHPRDRSDRVTAGALLEVDLPPAVSGGSGPAGFVPAAPIAVPGLTVVYDDDDIVVVNKPAGVAAHPSPGWEGPTVVGGLAAAGYRIATSGASERQGVVHRLDVGTSGLMVVAKSENAYRVLKEQFRDRSVDKRYAALVHGHLDPLRGTIDAPIDRHPSRDYKFAVVATGRPSVTHYDTVEVMRSASLLDIRLETGRTHQIRVHLAAMRHPCLGDLVYGADPVVASRLGLRRQWLHAANLAVSHPADGRRMSWHSDPPEDLATALAVLRAESG